MSVSNHMINVLVVDDSRVSRMLLVHLIESDPRLRVMGSVDSGDSALDFLKENKPDVVLMDIQMPRLDGFETTRLIMETFPVPIIICTATTDPKEIATTFRSMEAGAVACLGKPVGPEHPHFDLLASELLDTIKLMSEVKVVRRWRRSPSAQPVLSANEIPTNSRSGIRLIGIGASTGGPPVLQTILASLPKDFAVPILIVQHIAEGFLSGLIDWLNQTSSLQIQAASHGTYPLPGHVYLAPDDLHLGVTASGRLLLTREEPEDGLRPSVSHLFRSLANVCGPNALGVLLTGMGKDGAAALKLMKDKGATTIAQDRESSVVHGMPGEAIQLGAATHILAADKIGHTLITLVNRRNAAGRN
ncbi:MAG TPA: chemotaxis-specific protein-glutamate methyltransferase CheB [Pyrinomonadaceae bacterium]